MSCDLSWKVVTASHIYGTSPAEDKQTNPCYQILPFLGKAWEIISVLCAGTWNDLPLSLGTTGRWWMQAWVHRTTEACGREQVLISIGCQKYGGERRSGIFLQSNLLTMKWKHLQLSPKCWEEPLLSCTFYTTRVSKRIYLDNLSWNCQVGERVNSSFLLFPQELVSLTAES